MNRKENRMIRHALTAVAGLSLILFLSLAAMASSAGVDMRVSTGTGGIQGNSSSYYPSVSADGRYVAFYSNSSNLMPVDANGVMSDIFLKDTVTGITTMVSTDSAGAQGSITGSVAPSISADGRYVAFYTGNLLTANDTNGNYDIFLKDTQTGITTLVSSTSSDGAAYGGMSIYPSISGDARYIAFMSYASNLVAGDTNATSDIFVKDRQTGAVTRVSTDSAGGQSNAQSWYPAISQDGHYVAFQSSASILTSGDANGVKDIFVKDLWTGVTTMASSTSSGTPGNATVNGPWPSVSNSGKVAFASKATNLAADDTNGQADVFIKDLANGQTTMVSRDADGVQGGGPSSAPSISADGRYVAFQTHANLDHNDVNTSDIYVKDTLTGEVCRVSIASDGTRALGHSWMSEQENGYGSISADGRHVAFRSYATNMIPGEADTNGQPDVFIGQPGCFSSCEPGTRPALYLSHESFFASYADYTNRYVSVDFTVSNHGPGSARAAQITGAVNTQGASLITALPVALGDIDEGSASTVTVRYWAPAGVANFDTTLAGSAQDECGTQFTYPPEE